jgi:putative zinc finger/helix-turn-helix YgiT family protein
MTAGQENFRYDRCGLPHVTLVNDEVRRCRKCGEYEVVIPQIEQLHRLLAFVLARKQERLTPDEVRYLRKYLGWSGKDFAEHFGVTQETVSRWEQGKAPMSAQADRLLRLMVVYQEPAADYSLDVMKDVATKDAKPLRLGLTSAGGTWKKAA